jgi:SAM-dependent methyltransferase
VDLPFGLNPYESDPGAWGASLVNNAEILLAILDAAKARSVIEVGAYAGDLTRLLLLWAKRAGARVAAVDPSPQPELVQLERERVELVLIRETSLEALEHLDLADAIILDGDHNYYTVSEELRRIDDRSARGELPLLLFHDVCWPHARRDDYFDPAQIPAEYRQPIAPESGLYPGVEGTYHGGLPYHFPAEREGGPRNGVLTAIEDFVAGREELRPAVVPSFFGLGLVFRSAAPFAADLERLLEPYDDNPWLARLERNRVLHLASSQVQLRLAQNAQEQVERQQQLLERMLHSRAFAAAEMFLRLRQRGRPIFSRAEIRRVMAGD